MATTLSTPKAMHLDVRGVDPADLIPEALIIQASTRAGFVEGDEPAVRVPHLDFDDDAAFVDEGATITEADPDYAETVVHTGKVAVLAKVSREQWRHDNSGNLISTAMRRSLLRKANGAFLTQAAPGAGATAPPAGLLSLSPTAGGTVTDDLDAVADAVATIETAWGQATHIIMSPDSYATISKLKMSDGSNASLVGAGVDAPQRSLLGLPVITTPSMPDSSMLVLDRAAVLSAYGQVEVATSEDRYFDSDSLGVRVTFRFGQKLVDAARVVEVTVTEGS